MVIVSPVVAQFIAPEAQRKKTVAAQLIAQSLRKHTRSRAIDRARDTQEENRSHAIYCARSTQEENTHIHNIATGVFWGARRNELRNYDYYM